MLASKLVFSLLFFNLNSVFSIKDEPKIEFEENSSLSAIEVVTKDFIRHEGNMNSDMEGEVVSEAANLIVSANYTINTALATKLQQHMSQIFNGTWIVLVSDGHVYSSNGESEIWGKYVRFSYTHKMFVVTQVVRTNMIIDLVTANLFYHSNLCCS